MIVFKFRFFGRILMNGSSLKARWIQLVLLILAGAVAISAQPAKSQEISDSDGLPVLLKHLPDYENVRGSAKFTTDKNELKQSVNDPILDPVEFWPGTEAVTASYPEGRLVIVEYTSPQASVEIDARIQQHLAANPQTSIVYRRIGNYNAFVIGSADPAAANALLDQVKYGKTVQWLGEDPYILKKLERYMVSTSRDIMISTVLVIVLGLGGSILTGIAAGFIFFRIRDQKRAHREAFSDAGGLTRLNLDGLSE
jgi:hypothetical protein